MTTAEYMILTIYIFVVTFCQPIITEELRGRALGEKVKEMASLLCIIQTPFYWTVVGPREMGPIASTSPAYSYNISTKNVLTALIVKLSQIKLS